MTQRPKVELRPQEEIDAETKGRYDDGEKVATAKSGNLVWGDTGISSRYDKAHELETMLDMLEAVPSDLRQHVDSLFCDSKATCTYSVTLKNCTAETGEKIIGCMESAIIGHNGIYVSGVQGVDSRDPDWPGSIAVPDLEREQIAEFFAAADAALEVAAEVIARRLRTMPTSHLDHISNSANERSGLGAEGQLLRDIILDEIGRRGLEDPAW